MSTLSFSGLLHPDAGNHLVAWQPQSRDKDQTSFDLMGFKADVARSVAEICHHSGAGNDDAAILFLSNSYQFAVAFTALVYLQKKIYLPANGNPGAIQQLQNRCHTAIVDTALHTRLSACEHELQVINLEQAASHSSAEPLSLSDLPDDHGNLDIVIFTSGSTGEAKAIHKKLRCFLSEVNTLESLWGKRIADGSVVATVSHQHVYGLLFRLLWPLLSRRPFCSATLQYPEELLGQVTPNPSTLLISSPAFLSRLPKHLTVGTANVDKPLTRVFTSGGPLDPEDNFAVQALLRSPVTEVFGSTETGGVGYRERSDCNASLAWIPLPGVSVRQSPETLRLLVKSPYLFTDDWYEMGDVAVVEENHHFLVKGRADRVLKIEEKRISLDEIEARLAWTDSVDSARVLPLDGKRTELGAVVVLSDTGTQILETQGKLALTRLLRKELARDLEPVVIPRKWRIVDTLPVNSQGKIIHSALQVLFANSTKPD